MHKAAFQSALSKEQRRLAAAPLPRMQPAPVDWIVVDDAYAAQVAEKTRLLRDRRGDVLQSIPGSESAQRELFETIVEILSRHSEFSIDQDRAQRPDGALVSLDRDDPLATLGQLLQEDLCILQKQGNEHVLTSALLCFPASWTLSEKIGLPLTCIHRPVSDYTLEIAARVQRFFDGVRTEQPLRRANLLTYESDALFHPLPETQNRSVSGRPKFERSELQTVFRLPKSDAVVFAIHTTLVPLGNEPLDDGRKRSEPAT